MPPDSARRSGLTVAGEATWDAGPRGAAGDAGGWGDTVREWAGRAAVACAVAAIRFYQLYVSPLLPASCRYLPSCSEYTRVAITVHGPVRGTWLGLRRLGRCHPWGGHGVDPVPGTDDE